MVISTVQQMQEQPQNAYPYSQKLPANSPLQKIVNGTHVIGLPITPKIPLTTVNVPYQQAIRKGHNMGIPSSGMNTMAVNNSEHIPHEVQLYFRENTLQFIFHVVLN